MLKEKLEENSLFVFSEVTGPQANATAVFKYVLNTYQVGREDDVPWYEHTSLMEVMGYKFAGNDDVKRLSLLQQN